MRKLPLISVTLGLFVIPLIVKSQSILSDKKSETLFSIPKSALTPEFSSSNVGVTSKIFTLSHTQYYVHDRNKPKIGNNPLADTTNTMIKSIVMYGAANFVENTKSTLIFSDKTNISPTLEIGFSNTIDTLQKPYEKALFYHTFSIGAFFKYQNLTVYNKTSLPTYKYREWNPGIKAALNLFHTTSYAIALNASWQHSIDVSSLTTFKLDPAKYFSDANVSANGNSDGYLTPVNAADITRFSIALPVFAFDRNDNRKFQLAPTPYYAVNITNKTVHTAGIGFIVMPGRFYKTPNSKFASSLSLNFNLLDSGKKEDQFNVFIAGTFDLKKLKTNKKKIIPENGEKQIEP